VKEEKRMLGLVLVRGEVVVSLQVESPPKQQTAKTSSGGRGQVMQAGRGMAVTSTTAAAAGLTGAVQGIGGPNAAMMMVSE
jgi:small nuclear ribonucleoprotein B and B'